MTGRERVKAAMGLKVPDRVPLMCQLSLGFYFLNSCESPFDIWFSSSGFARALLELAKKLNFDGILVNLPGRDPKLNKNILKIEERNDRQMVHFKDGSYSVLPFDDNAMYFSADGNKKIKLDKIDPKRLFYIEPWDVTEVNYPYAWGFENKPADFNNFFPEYHNDTIKEVIKKSEGKFSIHAEIFSPFTQLLELVDHTEVLMAMIRDPKKIHACLKSLTRGTIQKAGEHAGLDIDAILISNPFAGGGFISPAHYREFVMPYDKQITSAVKNLKDIYVYQHICGIIGDRLELILETGADGIDTLDPPPLGNVNIAEAKRILNKRAFIKGNLDPVNTLLQGDLTMVANEARKRLEIMGKSGGYILSSACSVSPHTPIENILMLKKIIEESGSF